MKLHNMDPAGNNDFFGWMAGFLLGRLKESNKQVIFLIIPFILARSVKLLRLIR